MTNLLRGVVQRGTAAAAAASTGRWPARPGRWTNTRDAWFIGFDPNITVGVWVGYDEKKPLGAQRDRREAALPIWMDFMKALHRDARRPEESAAVRGAGQHRLRHARQRHPGSVHQRHAATGRERPARRRARIQLIWSVRRPVKGAPYLMTVSVTAALITSPVTLSVAAVNSVDWPSRSTSALLVPERCEPTASPPSSSRPSCADCLRRSTNPRW